MGYIIEPKGIDLVVDNKKLDIKHEILIREFILNSKKKGKITKSILQKKARKEYINS